MAKIQIYARVRPTKHRYDGLQLLNTNTIDDDNHHIQVTTGDLQESTSQSFSKAPGTKHDFVFKHVFNETSTQEEVFDIVAKDMIDSFLKGYNGTIFAYGQTSSGKTHTIEGSGRRFSDRGIIPRTLSYIFKAIEKRDDEELSVCISYMEIYQDTGYDLLNPGMRPGSLMVEIPKVQIAEGPRGDMFVRNLSSHLAATEEVAQSLLFQGSTCRKVAETSMNQCSSRSHTIFSIILTAQSPGCEVITRSKLNLVDLAGSERVAKTGADGRVLQEAKHINLSLHHLEHVIVSLQQQLRHSTSNSTISPSTSRSDTRLSEKSSQGNIRQNVSQRGRSRQSPNRRTGSSQWGIRQSESSSRISTGQRTPRTPSSRGMHIPYRNCMLTMVLKDSLGGNCLTAMIATISAEERNLPESISTCRFSQRVACISNKARRNEELDDKVVIKRLKQRIFELENEVEKLKENDHQISDMNVTSQETLLTEPDRKLCHQVLHEFFHGTIDNPVTAGIDTAAKFNECLIVLKSIVLHALGIGMSNESTGTVVSPLSDSNPVEELSNQVKERMKLHSSQEGKKSLPSTQNSVQTSPKGLQDTMRTSSSNSRLSSGFGSLHDEEYIESYDSRKKEKSPRYSRHSKSREQSKERKKRPHNSTAKGRVKDITQTPSPQAHNDTKSHSSRTNNSSRNSGSDQHTPVSTSKQKRKPIENAWTTPVTSPPQTISTTSTVTTPQADSLDAEQTIVSERVQILKIRSPRERGNVLSLPFSSENQKSPHDKERVSSTSSSKTFSPIQEKAVQKLVQQQVQLHTSQEQKKTLANEVQFLDLQVQEEKLRSELHQVGEQLVAQHLRVSRLQQQGQADPEKLCIEKIAEQQLRIKQAKLHQKLLEARYQYKSLQNQNSASSPNPLSPPTTTMTIPSPGETKALSFSKIKTPPNVYSPWKVSTQVQSELAKHELKQSKVQQQIEQLRISQMEKQLELKEATTRRKILALKQQLQGNVTSPTHSAVTREISSKKEPSDSAVNKTPSMSPSSQGAKETLSKTSLMYTYQHQNISSSSIPTGEKLHSTQSHNPLQYNTTSYISTPTESTLLSRSHISQPSSLTYHQDATTSFSTSSPMKSVPTARDTYSTSVHSTEHTNKSPKANHKNVQVYGTSVTSSNKRKEPEKCLKSIDNSALSQSPQSFTSTTTTSREKLTLPEEIKETEYMTALQRQKARVYRIRRCIAAATVIQRAWRIYKTSKR